MPESAWEPADANLDEIITACYDTGEPAPPRVQRSWS